MKKGAGHRNVQLLKLFIEISETHIELLMNTTQSNLIEIRVHYLFLKYLITLTNIESVGKIIKN